MSASPALLTPEVGTEPGSQENRRRRRRRRRRRELRTGARTAKCLERGPPEGGGSSPKGSVYREISTPREIGIPRSVYREESEGPERPRPSGPGLSDEFPPGPSLNGGPQEAPRGGPTSESDPILEALVEEALDVGVLRSLASLMETRKDVRSRKGLSQVGMARVPAELVDGGLVFLDESRTASGAERRLRLSEAFAYTDAGGSLNARAGELLLSSERRRRGRRMGPRFSQDLSERLENPLSFGTPFGAPSPPLGAEELQRLSESLSALNEEHRSDVVEALLGELRRKCSSLEGPGLAPQGPDYADLIGARWRLRALERLLSYLLAPERARVRRPRGSPLAVWDEVRLADSPERGPEERPGRPGRLGRLEELRGGLWTVCLTGPNGTRELRRVPPDRLSRDLGLGPRRSETGTGRAGLFEPDLGLSEPD